MKIYLAGAIRGNPNFEYQFTANARALRLRGHAVFNPLEKDEEMFGVAAKTANEEESYARNVGLTPMELRRKVFLVDTSWICNHADAVALMPGWETSKGANAEKALGEAIGLEIIYL